MSNSKELVKNQHYVPRFYLEHFSDDEESIHVYDKVELITFTSNAKKIANERFFYDLDFFSETGEIVQKDINQVIETRLNKEYEEEFSNFLPLLIKKLDTEKHFLLKRHQKEICARFIAYQYIRTKRFREESFRVNTGIELYETFTPKMQEAFGPFNPKFGHHLLLTMLPLRRETAKNLVDNYYWLIAKNESDMPFYTSDNPFAQKHSLQTIQDKFNTDSTDFTKLSDEIHFPLTQKYTISLINKKTITRRFKRFRNRILPISRFEAEQYNKFQLQRSYRYIYLPIKDFSFLEKIEIETRERLIAEGRDPDTIKKPKPKKERSKK
ncbi:hypothetical protein BTA37_25035 [Priestia megaterium]|uniref:DUF4238 domain-containing protein n=1 Tax=Priestia megaterium TaxID=1404 RepID=UPI00094C9BA6|nr:DUF4238 domain-containing protein [Priestia megaterium]OLO27525.1 hypothetical protein BTA37_25035 [Priestia megaterium]